MLTITDGEGLSRVLRRPLDSKLRRLLTERRDQLSGDIAGLARFLIAERGDTLETLETTLGFPIRPESDDSFGCEWIEIHEGIIIELVWILTDDGFAHVVFVTKAAGTDPELLRLCTGQA